MDNEQEKKKQFIAGLNPDLCAYAVVNDEATYQSAFRIAQREEHVNNRKKETKMERKTSFEG